MSLIVARKSGNQIAIVSDTKLTFPNHETKNLKENPSEGVIKSIILTDNVCISFAGEIEQAEEAFAEIDEKNSFEEVIEILYKHHTISKQKTEFLVCSGKPEPLIHKIKNGESKTVHSSWIGDIQAFNCFQANLMGTKKTSKKQNKISNKSIPGVHLSGIDLSYEIDMKNELFSKMSSAMDEVIEDSSIKSVGGFKVIIVFKETFDFIKYGKLYRGNVNIPLAGGHAIGHGNAEEGAYSINFIGASNDKQIIGLHILQGNFGIVYKRKNKGLLIPEILNYDEVDFIDFILEKYNMSAVFTTQDRSQKFFNDAKNEFNKREFNKAKDLLDKALSEVIDEKKGALLLYKGICFLNLGDIQTAKRLFQEAVDKDKTLENKVPQILSQKN